jgi:hypothetical protein
MAMALHDTLPISRSAPAKAPPTTFAVLGTAAGLGALFASSCCALPMLLGAVGAGAGMFAALDTLASMRLPLIAFAGLAVAAGWFLWWRKRGKLRERNGFRRPRYRCDAAPARPRHAFARRGAALGFRGAHAAAIDEGRLMKPISTITLISTITSVSTITCPRCGLKATETMPTDACRYAYECSFCGTLLKPKAGDCCVFCSYGDVPCPPIQEAGANGAAAQCCPGA